MKINRVFSFLLTVIFNQCICGQSIYTWSKLLSDSLIDKSRLQLGSAEQFDRENQIYYSVWASSSSNAKIQKFDLKNKTISTISAGAWPGEMYASVYDPSNKVIVAKRVGRDNTYYLNSSNVWTKNGTGSYDSESYGSTDFYNGASGRMSFIGGYGWYSTKNWIYEQTGTSWSILNSNQNSCSFPKRVGAKVASSKDNKILYILSGQGSCDGNQLASSCSLGSAWATDVGVYCWIRDLQKVDLSTNTVSKVLSPNHASIDLHAEFAYDYDENVFYTIGGYIPAPIYNRNTGNDSSVYTKVKRFRVGIDTAFVTISISGTGPSLVKVNNYNGVAFYDSKGKRVVWLRSDGVWSFSTSIQVNQWSGTGNFNNTSNWTSGSIPGSSDSVVIKSGTLTINQSTTLDVMTIVGGSTVKLTAPLSVRNLHIKNGTLDLNDQRLTVTGRIIQSTDSSNYYIQAGTSASPKSRSELAIKPNSSVNSIVYFNPSANRLNRFEIGNGSAVAQITLGSSLKIKGGEDGGSGPGLLTVNKNSKVVIPSGSILTLESDTFNAGVSLAQPAQRSVVCTGTGKINIERDHYGVRGWRLYSHPFKTDIDLQEVANDIELIGPGGTSEGFYSNSYKNAAAYWYDYSKADSSATTDPAWTAFTSAQGRVQSNNSDTVLVDSLTISFTAYNKQTFRSKIGKKYKLVIYGLFDSHCYPSAKHDAAYSDVHTSTPIKNNHTTVVSWNNQSIRPAVDVYRTDHKYTYYVTATDSIQTYEFQDNPYSDNCGYVKYWIYEINENPNKWQKNSTMLLFNPGNRRGTGAFDNPSTATYEQGKISLSYTLDSTEIHLNDGTTQTISTGILPSKSKYFFITNPFTAPVKLCRIQGLNSSNVDPYFYYWKQRRNTVTDNFSPAEWQSEKLFNGTAARDSNISIPAFGTILVRLKNSSSTTFTFPESAKQLTNYGYIIGGAKGASKTGLMFADATGSDIGSNGIEIKLLVNDSQEADRVLIYNEANQSPAYTNYDAAKYLNQDFPNVYTLSADNKPLSIDMQDIKAQLDAGKSEVTIPLGVNREANKRFATLKWELSENTTGLEILLKDLQNQATEPWSTGVVKNIALDQQSLTTKRYALVFKQQLSSNENFPVIVGQPMIQVYPNPTEDNWVNVVYSKANSKSQYRIFDMAGKQIMHGMANSKFKIDIGSISEGAYILSIDQNSQFFIKN